MKKILIVDDDSDAADLMAEFCRQADMEALTETDGLSVQKLAEVWRPDLITLDLDMPAFDGVKVLERLKKHAATKDIPVVVVSAMGRSALEEGLLGKGVQMVCQKPVPMQRLAHRLSQLAEGLHPPPQAAPFFETFAHGPQI
jgi:two-component system, OmpR family, alkaline phosphatase synthesis response regulator PhoP